jgi:hypothetical protein
MTAESPLIRVWTVGHSRHPIERFLGLLRQHDIACLIDARSQPVRRFSASRRRTPRT